ncbi:MAG: DUF1080 domain-containing protein [Bacteroidetes bacterium]|jgi:hypothetical protein|nr:MAG: hypothetical protein ABR90_04975 [Cryomorphaceae bacterium BACL29 MAG-121220-bin8]MDA0757558.1 DUF1080 domain-containing protein [Bacteroidota bacterium]MDA1018882.1 DUF1080 domain-containing protein [Bacteroidota bacterium]|tara:strand:+ start:43416 stop:44180 length:765 start_codon:yes stop_codon:yes gene_type:complete
MRYIFFFFGLLTTYCQTTNPADTEVWEPEPKIVNPGKLGSPPSDAIILFDGSDLSSWKNSKSGEIANWTINNDQSMTVKQDGGIETIEEFGSIQFHIEWKTPKTIVGNGQGRGNSGVMFQRRFEIQILDSYNNRTYSNGQAASIYKQYPPLVNATKGPNHWQTYDIVFMEAAYDKSGKETNPGSFIVFHNGILVQNNVIIKGTTEYIGKPLKGENVISNYMRTFKNPKENLKKTIMLQDHGNPVQFRNIWLRKL